MSAGQLRELITVQRRGDNTDNYGNAETGDWTAVPNIEDVPAQIRPLRAKEYVGDEGVSGRGLYEITVRYTPAAASIRISDRIVDARDESRTFNVKGPPLNFDQRGRFLKITAEAGGADG